MEQETARQMFEEVAVEVCKGFAERGGVAPFAVSVFDDYGHGLVGAFTVTPNGQTEDWVFRPALADADFPLKVVANDALGEWSAVWLRDGRGHWSKAA